MQGKALPGFRDFYPEELTLRNHIFATWRSIAGRYGFEEYDGPPLEALDLYTQKSGDEIVQQLYAFRDKGDRDVALRPEMTPTLARMVAARVQALKKPIRWFSIPQLFRYERQQRGRLREHFQLNMDIIGEASPLADAELMAAAIDIMRGFGLSATDVRLCVCDLFDAKKSLRAIAGGGRYDNLLDLPALGFGMGDVVLGELLKEHGAVPKASIELGAFLIAVGGEDLPAMLQLAHAMRERGIAVEYSLRHAGVRKQLELASARGAARAVIIGPEEREDGLAVVRNLRAGTEAKVPLDKLLNGYFD